MRTPRPISVALACSGLACAGLASLAACGGTATATAPPAADLGGDLTFRTTLSTSITAADGQVTTINAAGPYRSGAHPAADLTRAGGDATAPPELRLVDGALYIRHGAGMRPGGGGPPWTRVTRTTSSRPLARVLAAVERGGPATLMRMIGTSRDARQAGAGHRTGTFDAASGLRALAAADRWPARDLAGLRTIRFDVRTDSAGRPTRVTLTGRNYTLTQTFTRYGLPVRVTAPPPRQVGDGDGDGPVLPHAPRLAQ